MNKQLPHSADRRQFMKAASAVSALGAVTVPHVFAAPGQGNTIQIALVGCGGRGTGATANALDVEAAPTQLVAMADVLDARVTSSHQTLMEVYGGALKR